MLQSAACPVEDEDRALFKDVCGREKHRPHRDITYAMAHARFVHYAICGAASEDVPDQWIGDEDGSLDQVRLVEGWYRPG